MRETKITITIIVTKKVINIHVWYLNSALFPSVHGGIPLSYVNNLKRLVYLKHFG